MLTNEDYKELQARFVVPVVVSQMIQGLEPLDDVAEYTLDEMVSEMKPDTALLCIAMGAQNLAAHKAHLPSARTLSLHAQNIIREYGPLWLAHQSGRRGIRQQNVREAVVHIPEDLEAIADLLDMLQADLIENETVAPQLCEIFSAQARAQVIYAEDELQKAKLSSLPRQATVSGNVVVFPGNYANNREE